jgi:hypothetical protein
MKKQLPGLAEQFLKKNWLYKLIALTVALAIWVTTLQSRKETLVIREMEVEFVLKPHLAITNFFERKVKVKVAGPVQAIKKFNQSPQVISVNLFQAEPGVTQFVIRPGDVGLPTGLKLVAVQPNTFELDIKEVKKP